MLSQVTKTTKNILKIRAMFSEVTRSANQAPRRRESLQFSKARLVDFGQLPHGQIPAALQYSRPTTVTKLANGVRVATEQWINSQVAVTVTVKAGTRQQNINNSSVSQFISRLVFQGTSSRSKSDIQQAIDNLGGQLEVNVERQITRFTLLVDKNSVAEAVTLLGDAIANPTFDTVQVQAEKASIHKNASSMDPERNTIENMHYTSFRDHFLGQPTSGIRDNVYSITADQIKEFHAQHYVGNNIVVSAAGQVNAEMFNEAVNQSFGNIKEKSDKLAENTEEPLFTPSLMFQRDDQLPNTSIGAAFVAPGWNDPDFFAFNYFKRIIGQYRIDKHAAAHLNTPKLQYNTFHTELGNLSDVILHKPFYCAYSDTGLFINFIFGNQVFNRTMSLMSQNHLSWYAQVLSQSEVFRARNKYWNDLLENNCPIKVSVQNSRQIAYLDRLISRTQTAQRISNMDVPFVKGMASKWFWDKDASVTAWGPLHNLIPDAHYNRPYRRATLGQYSTIRVKYEY